MAPKKTLPYLTQYFFIEKDQRFQAWNFPNDSSMKKPRKTRRTNGTSHLGSLTIDMDRTLKLKKKKNLEPLYYFPDLNNIYM